MDASEVLNFFKDLGPVSGKFLDVLSISTVEDRSQTDSKEKKAVDLYLTSKDESGVFLPKEGTLALIGEIGSRIRQAFTGRVTFDHKTCRDERPCKNSGQCSAVSEVSRHQPPQITEAGDTVFNSPVLAANISCR